MNSNFHKAKEDLLTFANYFGFSLINVETEKVLDHPPVLNITYTFAKTRSAKHNENPSVTIFSDIFSDTLQARLEIKVEGILRTSSKKSREEIADDLISQFRKGLEMFKEKRHE